MSERLIHASNSTAISVGTVFADDQDRLWHMERDGPTIALHPIPSGRPRIVTNEHLATWLAMGRLTIIGQKGKDYGAKPYPRDRRDRRGPWLRPDDFGYRADDPFRHTRGKNDASLARSLRGAWADRRPVSEFSVHPKSPQDFS